jgi:hypothetical protein
LPYEILLKIFDFTTHTSIKGNIYKLNNLRHVCKFWYSVGSDPRLWHHVHLASFAPSNLLLSTSVLFEVSFKSKENKAKDDLCQKFISKVVKQAASFSFLEKKSASRSNFKYTKSLNLSLLCYLNCDILQMLLSNFDSNVLKSLNLSFCKRIYMSNAELNFFSVIGDNCPNLNILDMTGNEIIGAKTKAIMGMSSLCTKLGSNLKELYLDADLAGCLSALCVNEF